MEGLTFRGSFVNGRAVGVFLGLRTIILALVVGAGIVILQGTQGEITVGPLYVLLVCGCVVGGVFFVGLRLGLPPSVCVWSIMVADVILETALVHYSGGMSSQFSLIFCLSIIAAAFLLQVHGGLGIALLASFAYLSYGVLQAKGVLSPPGPSGLDGQTASAGFLHAYMHVSLFFMVGAVGGYLAQRIRLKGRELQNAETELQRLKVDTNNIINNMSSGILVVDSKAKILTINPTAEEILGVEKEDVVGLGVEAALGPLVPHFAQEMLEALVEKQNKRRHEISIRTRDGRRMPLGLSISILKDEKGRARGVIAVFQDLTEARKMQEKMRKADRLAAIGELSAGIAHEIRNPLASISGSIEVLYNELDLSGENRRLMELIVKESDRLDRIINDFLEFARLRPPSLDNVSLTRCLDDVFVLLRNNPALKCGIETEVRHLDGDVTVRFDEEQMKQVLLNLAINACEAMDRPGKITVQTQRVGSDDIKITFTDEGTGIGEEEIARLFEPFFTTKEGGTGLGLAIANKIVEAHGGRIEVRNRELIGAEFSILIPIRMPVRRQETAEVLHPVG
ncbi:MAG: PAS domain S-box protein [Candidatus Latescibacterota bacterium]|nr:MAG: PAS domain S-box protein [Candidatus Latescibacterota bacterium]